MIDRSETDIQRIVEISAKVALTCAYVQRGFEEPEKLALRTYEEILTSTVDVDDEEQ